MEHQRVVRSFGIEIVSALAGALPGAEGPMVGATDSDANLHGPSRRVLLDEPENAVIAEPVSGREFAARFATTRAST